MGSQQLLPAAAAKCSYKHRHALSLVLLLACSILTGPAAAAAQAGGRKLKQVTVFYDTPAAAGSTTVDINANAAVRPDGTFHAAGGASVASADAVSNPLLYPLTLGAYENRPEAASTSYTQIPLLLQQTIFPTLSYGLAEARGDALSTSDGFWGNLEFGYNPISNNLGVSTSTGTTNSVNVGSAEETGAGDPESGFAGTEFAGFSNDLTNLADSRADQSGQAIAYPYNIASPLNPLTCTQALLYAVTLTNYDLGAPVAPLPRENPPSVVPYCLTFFNFGTLDDFAAFVDENGEDELFFDNNRDGVIPGLDGLFPGGRVFNTNGDAPAGSDATGTTTGAQLTAPPVVPVVTNRQANQAARSSGLLRPRAEPNDNADAAAVVGLTGGKDGPSTAGRRPLPAGASQARANAIRPDSSLNSNGQPVQKAPGNFKQAVQRAVETGSPELQLFAESDLGSSLIDRLTKGPLASMYDGTGQVLRNITDTAVESYAGPVGNLTQAASNFTSALVYNATNVGLKAAVAGLESAQPLLRLGLGVNENLIKPLAEESRATANKLAERSAALLQQRVDQLPEGQDKEELEKAVKRMTAAPGSGSGSRAQMGKRRML